MMEYTLEISFDKLLYVFPRVANHDLRMSFKSNRF